MFIIRPVRYVFRLLGWLFRILFSRGNPEAWRLQGEMLSLVFILCVAIFGLKNLIAYRDLDIKAMPPQIVTEDWWESQGRIWLCCAEDFAVGLGCLLAVGILLRLAPTRRWKLALRVLAHVLAISALLFMIANVQIFHVLRRFLTLSLFQLGGGLQPERSIYEYATVSMRAAAALIPLAALAVHLFSVHTFPRFWTVVPRFVCRIWLLPIFIVGLAVTAEASQRMMFREHRADFGQNPHLVLA